MAMAQTSAISASGMLQVQARSLDGNPPIRGRNTLAFDVSGIDGGASVEGLELTLTPWMPAMGHGTSIRPAVTDIGGGHYRADNVVLFMPGLWELRVSIAGSLQDYAAPRFEIP